VVAEGDEGDEDMLEGCSPEHERRRRGSATVAEEGGRSFTSRGRYSRGERSKARRRGVVKAGIVLTIDGRAELIGVKEGVYGRGVKAQNRHLEARSWEAEMAGRGGDLWNVVGLGGVG
jgi:hypothetical protein